MKSDFCVIARPAGSTRYMVINHEPLNNIDARTLSKSPNISDARVSRFASAKSMVDFLNKEVKSDLKPDNELLAELEINIATAIRRYAAFAGRTGKKTKIDEIFVGHENYEVQVILGE